MKEHLAHMLDVGAINPSKLAWSNALVLVHKKDGGLRFCINFQKLNAHTQKDAFPEFWQTPMEESSKQYKAFTIGTLGFFQCERMSFGLCNGPATFQHLMTNCLGELNYLTCLVYLDDVVIYLSTQEEHIEWFQAVLEQFWLHGLKLKPSKCEFFQESIEYLGHSVSSKGV